MKFSSTYADLSFIPYNGIPKALNDLYWDKYEIEKKYPNFVAWNERISSRPSVSKARGQ